MNDTFEETVFEAVFDADASASDLPEGAEGAEAGNALRHAASLSMTKVADGLIDPKLVLSWLLTTLGAPALFVGLLVPIREAGALLPQLWTADRVHALRVRKWVWLGGSAVQGAAAGGIVLAGLTLQGMAAGLTICALLALLALARSLCSVSYKDILGKTVAKTRRGTVTGLASSAASVGVVAFALALIWEPAPRLTLVIGALVLAAAFWLLAATLFSTLSERPSEETAEPSGNPLRHLALLGRDAQLTRFIAVRGLLTATALAPPFLVLLGSGGDGGPFAQLGALVLASAVASLLSSYIWGRLADWSSRKVLLLAGCAGGAALVAAVLLHLAGLFTQTWAVASVLFVLMIAYHGVRQGRSTYLVDMAPADQRAAYTAVSNTVIGVILLASGAFGALASALGAVWAVGVFAAMSLAAAAVALGLNEVEQAEGS